MESKNIQNESGFAVVEVSSDRKVVTVTIDDYDIVAILPLNKADALRLGQAISEAAKHIKE
jgi:hypothetical protein